LWVLFEAGQGTNPHSYILQTARTPVPHPRGAPYKVSVITTIILTAAAFLGGALNALAGGGSLVTFPALLLAGLNPIDANASTRPSCSRLAISRRSR
jgi:hypothetical protein